MAWKHTTHGKGRKSTKKASGTTHHGRAGTHGSKLPYTAKKDVWGHKAENRNGKFKIG